MKVQLLVIAAASAILNGCCASIPPESVELSSLVGEMITSAKVSHVNMVNRHFDKARSDVEEFAVGEYKERFLNNVRKLYKERNPSFVELSFSEYDRAIERVLKKRSEWLDEVETNRRAVLQALEEHYSVLQASNSQVTSLLRSAAELSETRAALLERFGEKVGISGTKMKEVENKLLEGTNSLRSLMDKALQQLGD